MLGGSLIISCTGCKLHWPASWGGHPGRNPVSVAAVSSWISELESSTEKLL